MCSSTCRSCGTRLPPTGRSRSSTLKITLANRGLLQVDPYVSRRNLVLDDFDVAVAELARFRELGGGSVVDLTISGIRPRPARLREVSERTALHIVAGCGCYTQRAHP